MDRLRLDVVHVLRAFRARPGGTLALIAVLTLGIGVTSTMFALADPFLLRPLPYAEPERLVLIRASFAPGAEMAPPRPPLLADWQARADLFEAVAAHGEFVDYRVHTPAGATILKTTPVSPNFFDVLGVRFDPARHWQESHAWTVTPLALADGPRAWALGGPDAAGRSFAADGGRTIEVAGLLGRGFLFPVARASRRPDAIMPAHFRETIVSSPGRTSYVTGIARLKRGVSAATAHAALAAGAPAGIAVAVQPLATFMTSALRPLALGALLTGLLITIACAANVVNLMVARGIYRTREFATREAIGATRGDLRRLLLVEVAAVASAALGASLLLGHAALALIAQVVPAEYSYLGEATVTLRVAGFAALLGIAVVMAGFVAAWTAWRGTGAASINQTIAAEARRVRWTRFLMVAGQSATAMVLLVGGLFLLRSHVNLWSQDTGFSRESMIVSVLGPPGLPPARAAEDMRETVARLAGLPQVAAAAATTGPLLDDAASVGGTLMRIGDRRVLFGARQVTDRYFDATGTTLIAGRAFEPGDAGWRGVVVNEAFARRFWPGAPPAAAVGQIVALNMDGRAQARIVGIVPNAHDRALDRPPSAAMYRLLDAGGGILPHHFILRLRARADRPDAPVRQTIASVSPDAAVVDLAWLDDRLAGTIKDRSFATLILALFAAAGIGVTTSGLFGVMAFAVARRTREIAIRRAIGAGSRDIVRLVVRDAAGAAAAGALAGLVAGRWVSRFLASYLFGVRGDDPLTLTLVVLFMVAVVAAAAFVPARRAVALSPTEALRIE